MTGPSNQPARARGTPGIVDDFIEQCLVPAAGERISAQQMHHLFKDFATKRRDWRRSLSPKALAHELKVRGFQSIKSNAMHWLDVAPKALSVVRPAPSPSTPSMAAAVAMGKAVSLLMLHFDVKQGRFASGWSDHRIGGETGCAPAAVAALRAEGFGELRENPEIAAVRGDLEAVKAELAKAMERLRVDISHLEGRIATIAAAD